VTNISTEENEKDKLIEDQIRLDFEIEEETKKL